MCELMERCMFTYVVTLHAQGVFLVFVVESLEYCVALVSLFLQYSAL